MSEKVSKYVELNRELISFLTTKRISEIVKYRIVIRKYRPRVSDIALQYGMIVT